MESSERLCKSHSRSTKPVAKYLRDLKLFYDQLASEKFPRVLNFFASNPYNAKSTKIAFKATCMARKRLNRSWWKSIYLCFTLMPANSRKFALNSSTNNTEINSTSNATLRLQLHRHRRRLSQCFFFVIESSAQRKEFCSSKKILIYCSD